MVYNKVFIWKKITNKTRESVLLRVIQWLAIQIVTHYWITLHYTTEQHPRKLLIIESLFTTLRNSTPESYSLLNHSSLHYGTVPEKVTHYWITLHYTTEQHPRKLLIIESLFTTLRNSTPESYSLLNHSSLHYGTAPQKVTHYWITLHYTMEQHPRKLLIIESLFPTLRNSAPESYSLLNHSSLHYGTAPKRVTHYWITLHYTTEQHPRELLIIESLFTTLRNST